jgi:hypothetical protein
MLFTQSLDIYNIEISGMTSCFIKPLFTVISTFKVKMLGMVFALIIFVNILN